MKHMITKNTGEQYDLEKKDVPDLWHAAMYLRDHGQDHFADQVLDAWHLAHDLKKHILSN